MKSFLRAAEERAMIDREQHLSEWAREERRRARGKREHGNTNPTEYPYDRSPEGLAALRAQGLEMVAAGTPATRVAAHLRMPEAVFRRLIGLDKRTKRRSET